MDDGEGEFWGLGRVEGLEDAEIDVLGVDWQYHSCRDLRERLLHGYT